MRILVILIAPIIVLLLVYLYSGKIAPKPRKSKDRDAPYACGEDFPPARPGITINFFWYIVIFLVFDVIDFILALSYGINHLYPIMYLSIVILALIIALTYRSS